MQENVGGWTSEPDSSPPSDVDPLPLKTFPQNSWCLAGKTDWLDADLELHISVELYNSDIIVEGPWIIILVRNNFFNLVFFRICSISIVAQDMFPQENCGHAVLDTVGRSHYVPFSDQCSSAEIINFTLSVVVADGHLPRPGVLLGRLTVGDPDSADPRPPALWRQLHWLYAGLGTAGLTFSLLRSDRSDPVTDPTPV